MPAFFMMIAGADAHGAKRVDFIAESPDQAFQVARNVTDGSHCELWEGDRLLARMTKSGAELWQLLPTTPRRAQRAGAPSRFAESGAA
jgi:hypothetical protein